MTPKKKAVTQKPKLEPGIKIVKGTTKQEILERLEAHGLLYKVLGLSGREIVIFESTGHSSRKIGALQAAIEMDTELDEGMKDALSTLYVPLMACSEGDVPENYDAFFWMKDGDIEEWTREMRAINPKIFALLDEQEKKLSLFLHPLSQKELEEKKTTLTTSPAS